MKHYQPWMEKAIRRSGVLLLRPAEIQALQHADMNCRIAREHSECNKARASIRALLKSSHD